MKNLFKFLPIVVMLVSLVSCTNNNEKLITENETIIQDDQFSIDKRDVNAPDSGTTVPDLEEE